MAEIEADPTVPAFVNHPLWSRFLRWSTIRRKHYERPRSNSLVVSSYATGGTTSTFPTYEYTPLEDSLSFIRLATLRAGEFDDEIWITLGQHVLKPPSRRPADRSTLVDIRRDLIAGWEAFQTIVDNKYFFRNIATGRIQWEHPDADFHTERYQLPRRNDGVVPRYETISYVWGDTNKSDAIWVDGPSGPTRLQVTQSLSTVLRYLRYPGQTRTLWIDALCLNQTDYEELSRQVPRMHDIYTLAWMNTLWLGTEDATSSHALKALRYLGEQIVAEADTGLLFCSPNAVEKQWYDPDFELPFPQDTWDSIRTLLQRPWFSRLWVVQEIQPGAVVQCGFERVPVAKFTEAIYCLYSKAKLPHGFRPHLEQATGTLARLPALAFTRLLHRAATFKACTDPRDKIYGLLGLAPHKFAAGIKVDYEKTNTPSDVYASAFLNHLNITQRLEHFHNCFIGSHPDDGAPSWVPDWYSEVPGKAYIPAQFATGTSRAHYSVTSEEATEPGNKIRPKTLNLQGVRCGLVSQITSPLSQDLDERAAIQHVRRWQPQDLDSGTYIPTGESMRKAYAITLICGITKEREPDWILSSTDTWVKHDFGDQALFGKDASDQEAPRVDATANTRGDVQDALQCCANRLFFRTHEGYIGLGPAETQPKDVIAIFLGCSTPVVLRRVDGSHDQYVIVGECFVHGLHDNTRLLGPLPDPWTGMAAWVDGDRRVLRFLNKETQQVTRDDPRLGDLGDWERTEKLVDGDDPTLFDYYRHRSTGEVINCDPRLEPDSLQARGLRFDTFSLV